MIIFRTDASLQIGTGHVMRCLTLAEELRQRGASCRFVCRSHPGNLIGLIRERGFDVHELPADDAWSVGSEPNPAHALWLGAEWGDDAEQTKVGAGGTAVDWLIVDHYAIDARWEIHLRGSCRRMMVIDDLADRNHACDLLLDQTFGRMEADYRPLVPAACHLLCGSEYALLRPEFAALRPYSLQRRAHPAVRELLIAMGGVDKDNVTGQVLQLLRTCPLPADCRITVVMGATAPWFDEVGKLAQEMPWPTRVLAGVSDMAQVMAVSDLAIGAAGATSWERCCLGLPTAMMVLADNQRHAAALLEQARAARILQFDKHLSNHMANFIAEVTQSEGCLQRLSDGARVITDGKGAQHVAYHMMKEIVNE